MSLSALLVFVGDLIKVGSVFFSSFGSTIHFFGTLLKVAKILANDWHKIEGMRGKKRKDKNKTKRKRKDF